jgi:hypothetical protein
VALEEADHAQLMLQLGLVQVQVQPVDALKLEGHMVVEHVCGGSGYRHLVAPVDRAALTANGRFGDEMYANTGSLIADSRSHLTPRRAGAKPR